MSLHASLSNWRVFMGRKDDKAFAPFANKVLERDDYICQFCGFQAEEYQEVVNLDNNYRNNKVSNMATACCFCSQCFFLESVGLDGISGGQLIYLPEISQNELNSFCHVLFCAMHSGSEHKDTAQGIYRGLRLRCQVVEKEMGSGLSNPTMMGQMMVEYQLTQGKIDPEIYKDLRLLPSYTKFKVQLEAWAQSALAELAENAEDKK